MRAASVSRFLLAIVTYWPLTSYGQTALAADSQLGNVNFSGS